MICCDQCYIWYHFGCVGLSESPPAEDECFCQGCSNLYTSLSWGCTLVGCQFGQEYYGIDGQQSCLHLSWVQSIPNDWSQMICCDQCNNWYHFECVRLNNSLTPNPHPTHLRSKPLAWSLLKKSTGSWFFFLWCGSVSEKWSKIGAYLQSFGGQKKACWFIHLSLNTLF